MIHRNGARTLRRVQSLIKDLADGLPRHPKTGLKRGTLATSVIDDRQDSRRPSIRQGIRYKIHAPALSGTVGDRGRATMKCDVLASPHPFPIHPPAFTPQEHPDAQVSNSRTGMSATANPYPQCGLILRAASSIPASSTKLCESQARRQLT
jgi:hypothetical protein